MLQQQQQITALKNKEAPFCFNFLRSRFTFSVVIELIKFASPSIGKQFIISVTALDVQIADCSLGYISTFLKG